MKLREFDWALLTTDVNIFYNTYEKMPFNHEELFPNNLCTATVRQLLFYTSYLQQHWYIICAYCWFSHKRMLEPNTFMRAIHRIFILEDLWGNPTQSMQLVTDRLRKILCLGKEELWTVPIYILSNWAFQISFIFWIPVQYKYTSNFAFSISSF